MGSKSLPVLFFLLSLAGCGTFWQELEVEDLSYDDLFRLTAYVIDSEGFIIDELNLDDGVITSKWDYNKIVDMARFPIRRRVTAHVDPQGDGKLQLKLKIKQEALWSSYATVDLKNQKGWESYGYDKAKAQKILRRIKLMVRGFEPSKDFYEKRTKWSGKKESVPEVLREK